MKKTILIITDLEGISGISDMEQITDPASELYKTCCTRLISDTNAAVAGAFDGGAERVIVWDGHRGGGNFALSAIPLDPRAEEIRICAPDFSLDGVVGLMQIGAHAMSGTQCAFLDHTQNSTEWHDYYINGRRCGEMAQAAVYVGASGIPCVMMSGDAAACLEARQFFGSLRTAEVKYAVCRNHAECIPDEEAGQRIYEAAKASMADLDKTRPFSVPLPFEIRLEYNRADYCDKICKKREDTERLDARTVRRVVTKIGNLLDVLF